MLISLRTFATRPLGLAPDAKPDKAGLYVTAFGTFKFDGHQWEELVSDKDTVVNRDGTPACPTCKGTRQVLATCDVCDGEGVIECDECDGEGTVEDENDEIVECWLCMGSGEDECLACLGTGDGDEVDCEDCE